MTIMPVEQREGAVLAGRFRLDRRLGEGGMGIVWAATNTVTGRRVAIKMLRDARTEDPHVRRRFLREGRAASKVQHPNVVEILDVLELEDQIPAMVMELLEGESLGQRIRRGPKLTLSEVAAVMLPAVAAVGAAHAHGVVHRDLKPDNIFIAKGHEADERVIKVLDFGIAKIAAESDGDKTGNMTGTGAMLGTPYYMAPEQLFSDETLDYRCDIWALGVILYECLAGRRPTQGDNFADIVKVIATQKIVPFRQAAPDVAAEVGDLVERMLAFEKEQRPQSLREVRKVLEHYTDVMASTFGEPVLKPVKQSRDADASGETPGLRREDVALLLDSHDTGPSTAATLDAPAQVMTDTQAGMGLQLPSAAPKKKKATALYAIATVVALGLVGVVGVKAAQTMSAPPAHAQENAPTPTENVAHVAAAAPSPVPTTSAASAPSASPSASVAIVPPTTPITTPYPPIATARATAKPTATATHVSPPPATATGTTSPGGLVEKPPF
jgi:serine/threonine protein kinase